MTGPGMKLRFPLYAKILAWFLVNLLALGVAFDLLLRSEFHTGADWLLTRSATDRVQSVSEVVLAELRNAPQRDWDAVLRRFGDAYQIEFQLCSGSGRLLAGGTNTIPEEIVAKLHDRRGGPPTDDRRPERPEDMNEPPGRPERDGDRPRQQPSPAARHNFPKQIVETDQPRRYWLLVKLPPRPLEGAVRPPVTLVISSASARLGGLLFDARPWIKAGIGALVLTALWWLVLVRGITRSLGRINQATERIAGGQFDTLLAINRGDELGALAAAVNHMAARLAGYVSGQKRFLGDIAHELCAPIARIQMALGILEQRAGEREKPYVEDLREEVQHMSGLVNELLSFSKASLRGQNVELSTVSLAGVARRAVAREAGPDQVEVLVPENLAVMAEPELLGRAVSNLVRNAVRYAGAAGPVRVEARKTGDEVTLLVTDQGPGLPAEAMEHLFEPFFRTDTARTRETGGAGLGLAIVKSCLDACQARVTCRNLTPKGFQAEIVLRAAEGPTAIDGAARVA